MSRVPNICPHEQKPSEEHGGGRTSESPAGHPQRTEGPAKGSEEVDRPDLEIEVNGKRIMIDLTLIEWIVIGVIFLISLKWYTT